MKGRISSTIWTVVGLNFLALAAVFAVGYSAGLNTGGFGFSNAPQIAGPAGMKLVGGFVVIVAVALISLSILGKRIVKPVEQLNEYSEKFAAGDYRTRLDADSQDDFGYIAGNFNSSSEKIVKAVNNQEAQESLQRSVTDFLTIVSQIARGDLTLRGKVTNDALGNVVDSVNYMLDNFSRVLERVRNGAEVVIEQDHRPVVVKETHV